MRFRWAQLDLARQMETIDFIKEFIVLLAKAGYNGILLYLEDRVKTASYPYAAEGTYYTEDEMRGLVAFAAAQGMEVVPCVATLGHAERFLAHPELASLAELQGEAKGRFGGSRKETFCPTNPQVYEFLGAYLREVAALFPSTYFHAGLDEFWDYCLCERCRKAAPDYDSQRDLFIRHIERIDDILRGCGKRMMMWSDMFEYYTDAMDAIPKDVIMVDWQYQEDVRFYLDHLFDCTVEDRFARNRQLGLETFIAPVDMHLSNPRSYLEYAKDKDVLGCLMTSWEKSDIYLYRSLPVFVYAGYLMQGKADEEAFREMMLQVFGTDDLMLANGVRLLSSLGYKRHFSSISQGHLFVRDFRGLPYATQEIERSVKQLVSAAMDKIATPLGRLVARDILDSMTEQLISQRLKAAYSDVFDGRTADFGHIAALHAEFGAYIDTMEARWEELRHGIAGNIFTARRQELTGRLAGYLRTLQESDFVKIRICLPDGYGVEHLEVSLQFEDGQWEKIADSVYKPEGLNTALAEVFVPYAKGRRPTALRLAAYGMGGIGVCWAETCGLKPTAILALTGTIATPEALLDNDVKFAWFGSQSTREDYFSQARASVRHEITLQLA